jgi:hypothetical protein
MRVGEAPGLFTQILRVAGMAEEGAAMARDGSSRIEGLRKGFEDTLAGGREDPRLLRLGGAGGRDAPEDDGGV